MINLIRKRESRFGFFRGTISFLTSGTDHNRWYRRLGWTGSARARKSQWCRPRSTRVFSSGWRISCPTEQSYRWRLPRWSASPPSTSLAVKRLGTPRVASWTRRWCLPCRETPQESVRWDKSAKSKSRRRARRSACVCGEIQEICNSIEENNQSRLTPSSSAAGRRWRTNYWKPRWGLFSPLRCRWWQSSWWLHGSKVDTQTKSRDERFDPSPPLSPR